MMNDKIRKNLLDLKYSKYLQYYNTAIILLTTYIIAISIALISKQISISNPLIFTSVFAFSLIYCITLVKFCINFKKQLKRIPRMISTLNFS